MALDPDKVYSEKETAQVVDLSTRTLARRREDGRGPPYVRLSKHRIGYRGESIAAWLAANTYRQRVVELAARIACDPHEVQDVAAEVAEAPLG